MLRKCFNCKEIFDEFFFLKSNDEYSKRCQICRDYALDFKKQNLCDHNRQPNNCRSCFSNQGRNALKKWTITKMIYGSRKSDKIKFGNYDNYDLEFIDYPFIENLIKNTRNKCVYCNIDFSYKKNSDMITIERVDVDKPHIKSNCTLCCLSCNCRKAGREMDLKYSYI